MVNVLTVGHILIDMRFRVEDFATPDRESPIIESSRGLGGSAANVAVGIVKLGGKSRIIGKVGLDSFGKMAIDELLARGVDINGVKVDVAGTTGFSIVIINREGKVIFYGHKGSADELTCDEIDEKLFKDIEFVHIASLKPRIVKVIIEKSKKHKLFVTYDPGRTVVKMGFNAIKDLLPGIDILLINRKEAMTLSGKKENDEIAKFFKKNNPNTTIIKLGEKGSLIVSPNEIEHVPAFKVHAVDTTGAGDSFAAGLITSLGSGKNLVDSVRFGNAVAAIKVQHLGAQQIPTLKEVENFINAYEGELI
ncbi:MAG: carbohydrate kinase family protein [Candidatus Njordarchaeia archaeon]